VEETEWKDFDIRSWAPLVASCIQNQQARTGKATESLFGLASLESKTQMKTMLILAAAIAAAS